MSSSHICQACHRRLAQLRPRSLSQWQQRASFISLAKSTTRTTTDKGKDGILNLGDDARKSKGKYAALPERRQRVPSRPEHPGPADVLESLFEQSITEAAASRDAAPHSIYSLSPYKKVEALKEMIRNSSPPADSFNFFVEHFGPQLGRGPESLKSSPSYLLSTARDLIRRIISAKQRDPFSTTLPSATEVCSVYARLGMLPSTDWIEMMTVLIHNIINATEGATSDITHVQKLFSDLLGAWNLVCRAPGNFKDMPEHSLSQINWSHIPAFSSNDATKIYRKNGLNITFGILTPPFSTKRLSRLPPIVLSTFQLLQSRSAIVQTLQGDSARFTSALARIISVPGLNVSSEDAIGQDEIIAPFIRRHSSEIKSLAAEMTTSDSPEYTSRIFTNPQLGFNRGISFVNKRLHEALRTKNRHQVDELWSDVVQWPVAVNTKIENNTTLQSGTVSAALCNYFILVFMALRRPNSAIDVWNHMIQNQMTPTLETWDSMMSGCKAAKDHAALEGVWRKMQAARVQPDNYCWTTRISGLMACHQLDAAIRALDEMGRIWLDAAQKQYPKMSMDNLQKIGKVEGAVKPTIETVNAAIVGAFRHHKKEYASQILAWAGNYGISPDVNTYNILLYPLLRTGQTQQAMGLLQQMQNAGIEADETTFTTLLDETFRFAADLSPEEQKEMVCSVLDEMEAAGLKANLHTYGKIIYALLQSSSGDMTVVNIVLERMAKSNLEPSTHIYTSLVQYYFAQDPPQLDAVRSTVERASMVHGSTDHIFWDRVVEGYSQAGETAAALRIVAKAKSMDNSVSWLALKDLLYALARNEEWEVAKALVRDQIVETGGPLSPDEKGKEGQHRFWKVAYELGVVNEQGTGVSF
ncbi:uncharacterized protein LY89DRAFT_609438 [Mollisia scopiformis]|uniref:Pentatricopeptide repeat-containing protein n=1 Tax=Mollisia scopiformis TaxID=149040 RepID=A0A194XMR4_MOLSC|nr:uncharacterized protein LY89DRAFT_609438 [Mollisia scopiformis]KUJ21067.1 hypothetical protein LY89DRAFT_609438 [Mollisia scopiformis]